MTPPIRFSSTALVDHAEDLTRIYDPRINCLVWRRPHAASAGASLPRLHPGRPIGFRAAPEDVLPRLVERLTGPANAPSPPAAWLADVGELVEIYALLHDAEEIGVRLIQLESPMCPGFHVDRVGIRLVCTFEGPGTEWLDDGEVDRTHLKSVESGEIRTFGAPSPDQIHRMPAHAVGLLKGDAWYTTSGDSNEGRGVIHRSPPVRGGEPYHRVLLTLDCLD